MSDAAFEEGSSKSLLNMEVDLEWYWLRTVFGHLMRKGTVLFWFQGLWRRVGGNGLLSQYFWFRLRVKVSK